MKNYLICGLSALSFLYAHPSYAKCEPASIIEAPAKLLLSAPGAATDIAQIACKEVDRRNDDAVNEMTAIDMISFTGLSKTGIKLDINSDTSAITAGFSKNYSHTSFERFNEDQFSLKLTAPLDDGNGANNSIVNTALSGDFDAKFSWSSVRGKPTLSPIKSTDLTPMIADARRACEEKTGVAAGHNSCRFANFDAQEIKDFFSPAATAAISGALEENDSPLWFFSLEGGLSVKKAKYLDMTTLAPISQETNPYSIAGSIGVLPQRRGLYLGVGGVHKVTYEPAESETICAPAMMDEDPECETGIFAPMVKNTDFTAFAVTRYSEPDGLFGIEIIAGYDFEDNVFGVEAPIYFLKNQTGDLTGGVRLAWDDKEDSNVELGVFFNAPMNLLTGGN